MPDLSLGGWRPVAARRLGSGTRFRMDMNRATKLLKETLSGGTGWENAGGSMWDGVPGGALQVALCGNARGLMWRASARFARRRPQTASQPWGRSALFQAQWRLRPSSASLLFDAGLSGGTSYSALTPHGLNHARWRGTLGNAHRHLCCRSSRPRRCVVRVVAP